MSNTKANKGRQTKAPMSADDYVNMMKRFGLAQRQILTASIVDEGKVDATVLAEVAKRGGPELADLLRGTIARVSAPVERSIAERAEPYLEEAARVCERAMVKYKGPRAGAGLAYITRSGGGESGDVVLPLNWASIPESQDVNRQQHGFGAAAKFLTKKTGDKYVARSYLD